MIRAAEALLPQVVTADPEDFGAMGRRNKSGDGNLGVCFSPSPPHRLTAMGPFLSRKRERTRICPSRLREGGGGSWGEGGTRGLREGGTCLSIRSFWDSQIVVNKPLTSPSPHGWSFLSRKRERTRNHLHSLPRTGEQEVSYFVLSRLRERRGPHCVSNGEGEGSSLSSFCA